MEVCSRKILNMLDMGLLVLIMGWKVWLKLVEFIMIESFVLKFGELFLFMWVLMILVVFVMFGLCFLFYFLFYYLLGYNKFMVSF